MAVIERAAELDGVVPCSIEGVVVGVLIGLAEDGGTPIVMFGGQPGTAGVFARSIVDLPAEAMGGRSCSPSTVAIQPVRSSLDALGRVTLGSCQ